MDDFKLGSKDIAPDITETTEFFTHLCDVILYQCKLIGVDNSTAEELAKNTTIDTVNAFAGNNIYVAKKPLTLVKHINIYSDYRNGMPIKEIAKKHRVTTQWVYFIINELKKKHSSNNQRSLF